jgi:hypothetical protein
MNNHSCIKRAKLTLEEPDILNHIPSKYKITNIKTETVIQINNLQEFEQTLNSLRFMMVDELPHEIYDFLIKYFIQHKFQTNYLWNNKYYDMKKKWNCH